MKLDQIQRQFAEALLEPARGMAVAPLFIASPYQEDRLAVYRGNLTAIWNGALRNAYPVLHQLVGAEFFEQMARAYGRAQPSPCGDLNDFGAALAAFLAQQPVAQAYPYFADVAALEWQLHSAYYAADASTLNLPDLMAQAAGCGKDLQQARLRWHPAASLHAAERASVSIWQAHQEGAATGWPTHMEQAAYGLISRPDWRVELLALDKAGWLALQALQQGASLGQALELALAEDAGFDIAGQLQAWFAAGAFCAAEFIADTV